MPGQTLSIKTNAEIKFKDGTRWKAGRVIHTSREELNSLGVPTEAYDVIAGEANRQDARPTPTPQTPDKK